MSGMSFLDNLHLSDQPKQGELEISVFGRGFGECIVIGCGNGDYAVIDSFQNAETKRPIALDYLEKIGVDPKTAIKEVIITHWHSDHIGMMSELIKTANNSQIIINPVFSVRVNMLKYCLCCKKRNHVYDWQRAGMEFTKTKNFKL